MGLRNGTYTICIFVDVESECEVEGTGFLRLDPNIWKRGPFEHLCMIMYDLFIVDRVLCSFQDPSGGGMFHTHI